jgi:hypothetical protein
MKTSTIPNKTTVLALNQKAIEGVDKYLATVKSVTIAGTSYTPAALKATLQAEIDANTAADEGHAQYRQQVVAAKLARSKGRALRKGLKAHVLSTFGADAVQTLQNFGFEVPKTPGRKTAKSKAQSALEAEATRTAHEEANASKDAPSPGAPPANVPPTKS